MLQTISTLSPQKVMGYVLVAALVFASQSVCVGENYDVYLLAGQSNMDGRGLARELSAAQKEPIEQPLSAIGIRRQMATVGNPCHRNSVWLQRSTKGQRLAWRLGLPNR